MPDCPVISRHLQKIFADEFHIQVPTADTDLLDSGILDSLQFVELLMCLEREFGFRLAIETIELDDLRTLDKLAALLSRHVGETWRPPGVAAATQVSLEQAVSVPVAGQPPAPGRPAPARDGAHSRGADPASPIDGLARVGVGAR